MILETRVVLLAGCLLLAMGGAAGCGSGQQQRPDRTKLKPEKVHDGELQEAKTGEQYPERPGMEEVLTAAQACYDQGLRHNPIFAKGGAIVIRWSADVNGDLLSMDFTEDSFRGWAINAREETMADCITRRAREVEVLWSRSGAAPLRFKPEAGQAPASAPSLAGDGAAK